MPALTNVAHFLNLVVDSPQVFAWAAFQEITSIDVVPFSPNTSADDIGFPEDTYTKALAFFNAYRTYDTSEARSKFLRGRNDSHKDGREAVKDWITASWKEWRMSDRVADALAEAGFDGFSYHKDMKGGKWQDSREAQISDGFSMVAYALFGRDGVVGVRKRVQPFLISFIQGLSVASWKAQGRAWVRTRNKLSTTHADLENVYLALEDAQNVTAHQISRTIKRMKTILDQAGKFGDVEMTTVVALWEERLAELREATEKGKVASPKIPKALRNALAELADSPTMRFVVAELDQALVDMESQLPPEPLPDELVSLVDWKSGVEHLQDKTPDELWEMLGFGATKALPGFNTVEDPDGVVDPWGDKWEEFAKGPRAVPFGPRWHQLVGMVKLMHHAISGDPLLLMDEVGVGKTMQVIGTIVLYTLFRRYYAKNGCFPGAFGKMRCDTADGNLPDRPHVIIVPPPLFRQWTAEFRRYVQRGFLDLLPYQGQWDVDARTAAWDGVNTLRKDQMYCQKVLLVAGPAGERDLDYNFNLPLPVPPDRPTPDGAAKEELTLFGHDLGLVIIDEAAKLRNLNRQWTVVHELVEMSQCGIAMTATPIHNGPADLFHLGMALNIPGCDDLDWLFDMKKAVSRATRKSNAEFRLLRTSDDFTQALIDGTLDLEFKREQIDSMQQYVYYLRDVFQGYTIRRTIDSVDWEGKPISGLRKYFEKRLLLSVKPEEKRELANTASDIMNEHETSRAAAIVAQAEGHAFYGQFRRTHTHWKLRENPTWVPESLAEWEATKSTKLDVLVRMLLWHLEEDNRPPLIVDETHPGENLLIPDPNFQPLPRGPNSRPDHIVVYFAFPSNNPLIVAILRLFGILVLEVNGQKSANIRETVMDEFRHSGRDGPRVLLLSNVGMAGINLPEANILIALDQLWSHQDLTQLIGRVWRLPQEKDVIVYIPVLNDTTDMFLSVLSFTKSQLLSAFTQATKEQKHLFQHLLPPTLREMQEHHDDDELEDENDVREATQDAIPLPKAVLKAGMSKPSTKSKSAAKSSSSNVKQTTASQAKTAPKSKAAAKSKDALNPKPAKQTEGPADGAEGSSAQTKKPSATKVAKSKKAKTVEQQSSRPLPPQLHPSSQMEDSQSPPTVVNAGSAPPPVANVASAVNAPSAAPPISNTGSASPPAGNASSAPNAASASPPAANAPSGPSGPSPAPPVSNPAPTSPPVVNAASASSAAPPISNAASASPPAGNASSGPSGPSPAPPVSNPAPTSPPVVNAASAPPIPPPPVTSTEGTALPSPRPAPAESTARPPPPPPPPSVNAEPLPLPLPEQNAPPGHATAENLPPDFGPLPDDFDNPDEEPELTPRPRKRVVDEVTPGDASTTESDETSQAKKKKTQGVQGRNLRPRPSAPKPQSKSQPRRRVRKHAKSKAIIEDSDEEANATPIAGPSNRSTSSPLSPAPESRSGTPPLQHERSPPTTPRTPKRARNRNQSEFLDSLQHSGPRSARDVPKGTRG